MRKVRVILGAQATGKTFLVKSFLSGQKRQYKKTVIIDVKGEYFIPGALYFSTVPQIIDALAKGEPEFIFILQRCRQNLEFLAFFMRYVRNVHFIVEEARLCIPKKLIDNLSSDFKAQAWLDIVSTLKEANIEFTVISQRPVDIPAAFLSQIDEIFCFRLSRREDTDNIVGIFTPSLDEIKKMGGTNTALNQIMADKRIKLITAGRGEYIKKIMA